MARKNIYQEMQPIEVYIRVAIGELKKFPNNYLDKQRIKEILRHIVLKVYNFNREQALKLNHDFFSEHYMGGFRKFFDFGESEIIIYSFPEWDIKYWEFNKVPPKFWEDKQNQKEFVEWIAKKENLDITTKEGLKKLTAPIIMKHGGSKALTYAGGEFELLNSVANGQYMKWEIIKMTAWKRQDIIEATKWLIEEKLQLTPEQVCKISVADFAKYNLDGMLQKGCKHSILGALELAYPGKYYRTKARGIMLKE